MTASEKILLSVAYFLVALGFTVPLASALPMNSPATPIVEVEPRPSSTPIRHATIAPTLVATSTLVPTMRGTPDGTVRSFYTLIGQRSYADAYALLSSAVRSRNPFQVWQGNYATTTGVRVENARVMPGTRDVVEVTFVATDSVDGRTKSQRFSGTWTLVFENAEWKLDTARIVVMP
jgi:hypothetical protein